MPTKVIIEARMVPRVPRRHFFSNSASLISSQRMCPVTGIRFQPTPSATFMHTLNPSRLIPENCALLDCRELVGDAADAGGSIQWSQVS